MNMEGAALKPVKLDEKFSGWVVAAGLANDEKEEVNAFDCKAGAVLAAEENKLLEPAAAAALPAVPKLNILLPVVAAGLIDVPKDIGPCCCCCCC